MTYKKDNDELLLFLLKQLVREHMLYERSRHGGDADVSTIAIPEAELIDKVRIEIRLIFIVLGSISEDRKH